MEEVMTDCSCSSDVGTRIICRILVEKPLRKRPPADGHVDWSVTINGSHDIRSEDDRWWLMAMSDGGILY
jgi:hypothetical protein